jgi:hypothetical protein
VLSNYYTPNTEIKLKFKVPDNFYSAIIWNPAIARALYSVASRQLLVACGYAQHISPPPLVQRFDRGYVLISHAANGRRLNWHKHL